VNGLGISDVFIARGNTPEENVRNIFSMTGGIGDLIGPSDIVVLKPNSQWWHQGTTNTDAMKGFIDLVLGIPGFKGEIIIADNHQYSRDDSRGWNTDNRNGRFNLNELVGFYQKNGHKNVSKYHWHVAGSCKEPLEGDAQGKRKVAGPHEGDGYVWMRDHSYVSPIGRRCLMTYPVFTSSYSGITIDLKNGAWENGGYIGKKVKLINFSGINHHSPYAGVTGSVKNMMGVVDMTCGWPGDFARDTYNVHHIGISRLIRLCKNDWFWRLGRFKRIIEEYATSNFHHTGGALGNFMKHVRMPDFNIITAVRVGWGSRTDMNKAFEANAILAGTDPVALDYVAARDILLKGTPDNEIEPKSGMSYRKLNDPDNPDGPFRKFLEEAYKQGIGNIENKRIRVIDCKT
jgi:uncharacterized protein (DUF362 family)